jgi:zinc protease
MFPLRLAAAVLTGIAASTFAHAAAWPEIQSDLPPDPAVHWGMLPNGLRYAVRHNSEPKGRVSLRLLVAAGSLEERESERGIAHFIEHMAFRGTRRHPNGSLTTELQRLGVGFGPDSSAFTFWDHTIYQLELPDNREATLREGLGVFREYAAEVTFDPALIDRERGVVLNELDTRDTPEARSDQANLELLWPASLEVQRRPIGLAANIRRFTRREFLDFYRAWYRPERMEVVVVGDIEPDAAARLIVAEFGGLTAAAPARADVIPTVPADAGPPTIRLFEEHDFPGVTCRLEHPFREPAAPDTHARRVQQLRRAMAFTLLQRRAAKLAKGVDGKFVAANANVSPVMPGWATASFGASGNMDDWKSFMASLEQEQRRAYDYGFTAAEVDLVRTLFATGYADAVRTAASWHSDWLATAIANSLLQGTVFSTPALMERDLAPELAASTPDQCRAEFRRTWSARSQHVFVAANPSFHVDPRQIADALNASRATAVARPEEKANAAFAYTDFGPPGRIVFGRSVPDLGVEQAEFANGVRLNFKPTAFEVGSVAISVRVGSGRLSQPRDRPGLDLYANDLIGLGGLGRHPLEELKDTLAAHALSVSFIVDSDAFDFSARCAPKDLDLCLRLIAAYLTDAGYRPDAVPLIRANLTSMYSSLASSPAGPISMAASRVLSGGDARFGIATYAEVTRLTIPEARDWLDPQLKHGPVELGVAGDVTWDAVATAVGETLGALPPRGERTRESGSEYLEPPRQPKVPSYLFTTDPALRQVALSRFCPVPDLADVQMERRCRLLGALLAERMRVRLRMELGAAYGFDADFVAFDGFPDFSYFAVSTTVSRADAFRANQLMAEEIEALRRGRFTSDEFDRVKQPFLSQREEDVRDNGYWSYTVLRDAQQRPERLVSARNRRADCAAISRADLEALAARYFEKDRWFVFTAFPQARSNYQAVPAFK